MWFLWNISGLLIITTTVLANYHGPFIMWGRKELKNIEISSLQGLDDSILRNIYSEAPAIILFVRNGTSRLSDENFPMFQNLIKKTKFIYLPQHWLSSDPVDYNVNAEVINLVGLPAQQDIELSGLYLDAMQTYGEGKVLGILATKTNDHEIRKRASELNEGEKEKVNDIGNDKEKENEKEKEKEQEQEQEQEKENERETEKEKEKEITEKPKANDEEPEAPEAPGDNDTNTDYTFYQAEFALLHTRSAPILKVGDTETALAIGKHFASSDKRNQTIYLNVRYHNKEKLTIKYIFDVEKVGYWTLIGAEINNSRLEIKGEKPSAPIGFSYKCSKPLIFSNENLSTELKLNNIQVQAKVLKKRFGEAFHCIGFTTAPIWSGIFVSFVLCFVVAIGINCILEIKPPNRFENSRGKQLTFTIQE